MNYKKNHYCIVGAKKCGTTSLWKYMAKRFGYVFRNELWFSRHDGVSEWLKNFPEHRPVIILRDPVERCWSDHCYELVKERHSMSYEEAVAKLGYDDYLGETNYIRQSLYTRWIKPWILYNPLILYLEDMQKNPDFPVFNKNDHEPMPMNHRNFTKNLILVNNNNKF